MKTTCWHARIWLAAVWVCLCCVLVASSAVAANRTQVWYDHANAPLGYTRDDVHTMINLAIREWEQHSNGQVVWRFMGDVAPGEKIGGPSNITIWWNPAETACARAQLVCGTAQLACSIAFNPGVYPPIRTAPVNNLGPQGCGIDAYGTLIHEMAHLLYPTLTQFHYNFSVLSAAFGDPAVTVQATTDFQTRHLWNRDMDSVHPFYNPVSRVAIDYDFVDMNGVMYQQVRSNHGVGAGNEETRNFVASLGSGPAGNSFIRVSAMPSTGSFARALFYQKNATGDMVNGWSNRVLLSGTTRHQTCVTSDSWTGQHLYVVFTSGDEAQNNTTLSSTRSVMFIESHDGGAYWSNAVQLAGGLTREGVTCSYDVRTGMVVVGVSGTDERIYVTHRLATSVGGAAWAGWYVIDVKETNQLLRAFTPFPPQISFDPYSSPTSGAMTWFDWQSFSHRIENIAFNSVVGRYEFVPPPNTVHQLATTAFEAVRSKVVPNVIGTRVLWAFSRGPLFCPFGPCPRNGRTEIPMDLVYRRANPGPLPQGYSDATISFSSTPTLGDFQSFGDAAPDRVWLRNAYLRYVLLDSF